MRVQIALPIRVLSPASSESSRISEQYTSLKLLVKKSPLGFDSFKFDIIAASWAIPHRFDPDGDESSVPFVLPHFENARD